MQRILATIAAIGLAASLTLATTGVAFAAGGSWRAAGRGGPGHGKVSVQWLAHRMPRPPHGPWGPHGPMDRGGVAALVAGLRALLGASAGETASIAVGTLDGVSGTSFTLTVLDGAQETVTLAAYATVTRDGRPTTLDALAAGDQVLVALDGEGQAVLVAASGAPALVQSVEGRVLAITATSITIGAPTPPLGPGPGGPPGPPAWLFGPPGGSVGGSVYTPPGTTPSVAVGTTYTLATDVTVRYRGATLPITAVVAGDLVHLTLNASDQVTAIEVQQMESVLTGTVVAVFHRSFLLATEGGGSILVRLGPGVSPPAEGDTVTVTGRPGPGGIMAESVMVGP